MHLTQAASPGGISIHALLAESDRGAYRGARQSRPISIHALLAESDSALAPKQNPTEHFYPRSPCGERQSMQDRPEEK